MTTWQNWAGNQIARGLTPSHAIVSNDDVVEVVKKARREKNRIKVVGTGHSFSGIARPEEVVVSLGNLSGIIRIDRESSTVVVRAGTTIADLNIELHRHGLAMPNLGEIGRAHV